MDFSVNFHHGFLGIGLLVFLLLMEELDEDRWKNDLGVDKPLLVSVRN